MARGAETESGNARRQVSNKRSRSRGNKNRRRARVMAAIRAAVEKRDEIHSKAQARRRALTEAESNRVASLTRDLRGARRNLYAAGVPEGSSYRPRYSSPGRDS